MKDDQKELLDKAIRAYYREVEKIDRCTRLNIRHKDKRQILLKRIALLKRQTGL